MRASLATTLLLVAPAAGLQQPHHIGRRAVAASLASAAFLAPISSRADEGNAPTNSMPYPDFRKAIEDKRVEGVVFQPPMGNEAYAIIDGKSIRIGEGWPVEVSNGVSSPMAVVRILENEGVPYAWNFNLKAKSSYKDKMLQAGEVPPRYDPRASAKPSVLRPTVLNF